LSRPHTVPRLGLLVGLAAAAAAALPAGASAAPWKCEASALRGTIATGPPIEPVTANKGAAACAALDQGGSLPATPLPVAASGFFARTGLTGPADRVEQQTVSATGGLADISIPLVPGVPGLPAPQLPPQLSGGVINVPGIGTVDLRPAIAALTAPTGDLIHVGAFTATARGRCSAGNPALSGSSDIASLRVLGLTIATDKAIEKAITIDSRSLDPSNLDLSKAIAPAGVDLSQLQAALQPLLDQFPNIEIPAEVAHLKISPNRDIRTADALTRRALELELSLGGQNVLDLVLGEATVSSAGVSCGSIAAAALGCTKRKLTLIDVVRHGNRVSVLGAADSRRFAGRKVDLVSSWNGKTVAHPTVGRDGLFRARLKLPPARLRGTNRARYEARLAGDRSLNLKLVRRMFVDSVKTQGRKITIKGHVTKPLASPIQTITVTRRVSCGRVEVAKRFKPRPDGRFTVTLTGAKTQRVATFRFRTKVRFDRFDKKLHPTFTLPRYIETR
jgi:hypothetical protein